MYPCVVGVWVLIPAALPLESVVMRFDIVNREITSREPSDIKSCSLYRFGVSASIKQYVEESWFVGVWVELCLDHERIRREVSLKQSQSLTVGRPS